jgi:lycopene cyclase domain-containing protein
MPLSPYLLLEVAIVVFCVGFGWEHWTFGDFRRRSFWVPCVLLAIVWFLIDQVAVGLGLWSFPQGGTLRIRLLSLPVEEYLLFFVHTVVCFLLLRCYKGIRE